MKYQFPIIKNISDVLPALEGKEEFIIAERDGFKVVNYLVNFEDTFPQVIGGDFTDEQRALGALRRECRGIKFDAETGEIICRPLHKFFNANEKPETHFTLIDLSQPHVILDKLDGSFISPFYAKGRMIYGTKMGETNVSALVHAFVADKPQYQEFNEMLLKKGFTPTYEYVGPDNRIVISYKESKLILLAIRDMYTGEYHDYQTMADMAFAFDIPVVGSWGSENKTTEEVLAHVRGLQDSEGYVLRFASGYAIKMKADEYVLKHKVKDSLSQEKNLLELIFTDKIDDVYATLDEADVAKVKTYVDAVLHHSTSIAHRAENIVSDNKALLGDNKKRFALEVVPNYKEISGLLFAIWDGKDAHEVIKKAVLNSISSQTKVEAIRPLIGQTKWADIYTSVDLDG